MSNPMAGATRRIAQMVRHPVPPVPPQSATFVGVATLTTSRPDLRGPFTRPVSAELLIDARGDVTVTGLCVGPVKLGSVTCTITQLPRTATGTYVAGEFRLTLGLHIGVDVLRGAQNSDLTITLTTDSPGSRATPNSELTLVGTGTFQNGYLGGRLATMVVNGTICPAAELQPELSGGAAEVIGGVIEPMLRPAEAPSRGQARRRTGTPAGTWRARTC
jgi:hypothetical protein